MIPELPEYVTILLDGYEETFIPSVLRTEFEDHYVRQESRVSVIRVEKKVKMVVCSVEDLREFRCWYRDELKNGAYWFTYNDPIEGKITRGRFKGGDLSYRPRQKVIQGGGTKFEMDVTIEVWFGC